jgi:hypothetical protein
MTDDSQDFTPHLEALGRANRVWARLYPGDPPARQPIHTVYGGAHLYKAETTRRLGELALRQMARYAPDAVALARGVGFLPGEIFDASDAGALRAAFESDPAALRRQSPQAWLAFTVHDRVLAKLRREPVEDFRIDFEDGYGARADADEDATAVAAAGEVARGLAERLLPPFIGIRIKSFGAEWQARGARTLEIFVDTLLAATGGRLPDNFVITLPKVTIAEQPRTLVRLCERLEARHGLPAGALRLELMIETTQALLGPDGRSPLPAFLEACAGRCRGAHFGTYDFTASCNITAAYQSMDHPWCDLAKGMMMLAYAGTGIFLSDGATNVMPVGPHRGEALTAAGAAEPRRRPRGLAPGPPAYPSFAGGGLLPGVGPAPRPASCPLCHLLWILSGRLRRRRRAAPQLRGEGRPGHAGGRRLRRRGDRAGAAQLFPARAQLGGHRAGRPGPDGAHARGGRLALVRQDPEGAPCTPPKRLIRRNLHDAHELETATSQAMC